MSRGGAAHETDFAEGGRVDGRCSADAGSAGTRSSSYTSVARRVQPVRLRACLSRLNLQAASWRVPRTSSRSRRERIAALGNGTPDCTVNEDIMKSLSDAFQPPDCEGDACTAYKAIIISLENTDEIPDGSLLFTCHVQIAADATGTLELACTDPRRQRSGGNRSRHDLHER